MHKKVLAALIGGLFLYAGSSVQAQATEQSNVANEKKSEEKVVILGKRAKRISKGATGLSLEIKDTPQSISVLTNEQIKQFGASDINAALRLASNINVEEFETNRTSYMSRGYNIINTQIDGTGTPNEWAMVTGAMDSFGYNKIEVIRGANGLLTGVGNASGTINYVRKRPSNHPQREFNASIGSYKFKRLEADISQPLTDDGRWSMRIVGATENKDAHIRGLHNKRHFMYGVIDGQIGDDSTLTFGYSYQDAKTKGNSWGGLVYLYSDGSQAQWDQSASTAQDWTQWNTNNQTAFLEFTHSLNQDWEAKATLNHRKFSDNNKLFYTYTQTGIDKKTGLGLMGYPGNWPTDDSSTLMDLSLSGDFVWFGLPHQLTLGASYASGDRKQYQKVADSNSPAWGELPGFPYGGNVVAEPVWGNKVLNSDIENQRTRLYSAGAFSLTPDLKAIVGVNAISLTRKGQSENKNVLQKEEKISPYAGLTLDLNEQALVYASYSDIYQNQDSQDIKTNYLPASKGVNYELGIKSDWLNKNLLTTLAWFDAKQKGLATFGGTSATGISYYIPVDIRSRGLEAEITGRVSSSLEAVLAISKLKLTGNDGKDIYEWVPRQTVNFMLRGNLPQDSKVSWGLSGQWRSQTSKINAVVPNVRLVQKSYAVLNAYAAYQLNKEMSIRFNLNNLSDKKYISSLLYESYYAAPRNASLSINYKL
jgi:outer membrane receptor for ferric coprogen and ferric-rhodotorulic acid